MLFEKTYNKLLNYYLLKENSLNEVPRKIMGLSTNIQDIPDNPPYGFWIDRSGNFIEVGYCDHERVGHDLIKRCINYLRSRGIHYSFNNRVYGTLFSMGWARVVIYENSIFYEMGKGEHAHQASVSQMKFLNMLKDIYDKTEVKRG
jgi:hypothetical protein